MKKKDTQSGHRATTENLTMQHLIAAFVHMGSSKEEATEQANQVFDALDDYGACIRLGLI